MEEEREAEEVKGRGRNGKRMREAVGGRKGEKGGVGDEERAQVTTNRLVGAWEEGRAPNILGHNLDVTWVSHRSHDDSIHCTPFPIGVSLKPTVYL